MIISKTPYRISFFGGGSDYPSWYIKNGGKVLSTTINKYLYITCRKLLPFFNHKIRIIYSRIENVKSVDKISHPSVKATLKYLNINAGLEIHYDGELPARSGLGSSSAFTVGLLNALYAMNNIRISKKNLSKNAITIEQKIIKENVGSQDQIAASYGGLNVINFYKNSTFKVSRVDLSKSRMNELESSIVLVDTGISRSASEVAKNFINKMNINRSKIESINYFANEGINLLQSNKYNLKDFSKILTNSWHVKKNLTLQISNSKIDKIFQMGLESGAIGGKLLGAGGGGFLLFIVPQELQKIFYFQMKDFLCIKIKFDNFGSKIIHI